MFFLKQLPTQEMLDRYASRYSDMDVVKTSKALQLLRVASLFMRKLDTYFSQHDLSQTRFLILMLLDREPVLKALTMGDLVERLDVSKPGITRAIKTLVKDNLVKVIVHEDDARTRNLEITQQGQNKLSDVLPGYYRMINKEMDDYHETS